MLTRIVIYTNKEKQDKNPKRIRKTYTLLGIHFFYSEEALGHSEERLNDSSFRLTPVV